MNGFKELLEECKEFVADDPDYYGLELSTKDVRLIVEALEKYVKDSDKTLNDELHHAVLQLLFEDIIDSDLANKLHVKIDRKVKDNA